VKTNYFFLLGTFDSTTDNNLLIIYILGIFSGCSLLISLALIQEPNELIRVHYLSCLIFQT